MTYNPNIHKEKTICSQCQKEFEINIWTNKDGSIGKSKTAICGDCFKIKQAQENKERLLKELPEYEKRQRDKWYSEYGVEGKFTDKSFKNYKRELQPVAFDKLSKYESGSIVLSSPDIYGVGKTHLVSALANQIVANFEAAMINERQGYIQKFSCPVYFTTESKLSLRIRQSYEHKFEDSESESDIFNKLNQYPLLIIDDVGKVKPNDYKFLQGVYFRLIDERYVNEQDIILTTNLSFKELEEHLGGSVADRLREMCGKYGFIKMAGKSYRALKQ